LHDSSLIYKTFTKAIAEAAPRKDIDLSYRVTIPADGWIAPLRLGAIHRLKSFTGEYQLVATMDRIPPAEFQDELRRSRIRVSPFGHGEICIRDFEVVLSTRRSRASSACSP
jgi:hypothetical protein